MSRSSPIWKAYQSLISSGRLQQNAEQAVLAIKLGELQHKLTHSSRWRNIKHNDIESGIYIYGGVGTGKSRIADLFAATLPSEVTRRRTHFFEFMTDIHQRLHVARSQAGFSGDPLVKIGQEIQSESCVLCLDEFQVSDIADAMILKRLFDSFWDRGGIMVSTSNRHPTELYKNGLNRGLFVPFIQDMQRRCVVFEMKGKHDYRMGGKRQHSRADVFYVNAQDFHASLTRALDGAALEPESIPVVMKRSLVVDAASPQSRNGSEKPKLIVSSTFAQLCEAFVGATDYYALCNAASTIYISGLRKFRSDELDIVRRFITLVDVAYEARTRVLCLSTDPVLNTFENIILSGGTQTGNEEQDIPQIDPLAKMRDALQDKSLTVKGEGGSSSSMMSTFINDVEWSATGLQKASLATGGAGETDVRFAVTRAISRLSEMCSEGYGTAE